jgi:ribosomal protein S18 acetylase RimI-like enzyme
MIVAETATPVGRYFVDRREREIRIMDVALAAEARNRGVGTALIRSVLDEGTSSGKRVTIHVEGFNPALRLYERLGFQRVDTNGVYYLLEWRPETGDAVVT